MTRKTVHLDAGSVPAHLRAGYQGKKFKAVLAETVTIPIDAWRSWTVGAFVSNTWQDGSRDTYSVLRLEDGAAVSFHDAAGDPRAEGRMDRTIVLEPGYCVLCHSIFRGKDLGLTFYVRPQDAAPMLPAPVEVTGHEAIVLQATRQFRSSYGGRDRYDMAMDELETDRSWITGHIRGERQMTRAEWAAARQALIDKGMLTKAGAITPKGLNAIGGA